MRIDSNMQVVIGHLHTSGCNAYACLEQESGRTRENRQTDHFYGWTGGRRAGTKV